MPQAPAPSRATATLTLRWALVNVPISIYTGTEDSGIKRSQFTTDGRPVGNARCAKNDDGTYDLSAALTTDDIVKRYQCDDGTLVDLSDDDIAFAAGLDNDGIAEVVCAHPVAALGSYHVEKVDQVRGGGKRGVGEKPFDLLLKALKAEKAFALVRYASKGSVRYAALTATGEWLRLHYTEEIRESLPLPTFDQNKSTIALARDLVKGSVEADAHDLADETSALARTYAEAKAKDGEKAPRPVKPDTEKQAVDLMATLQASVEKASKGKREKVPA